MRFLLPAVAFLFLFLAVVSGTLVSQKISIDTFQHIEVFGSGFQRLKHFVASALYLQLDQYHHIEMYQGISWTQITDYFPQMWLIVKLDPHFTDVYSDAAYQLAVNLGRVHEGMDFIKEGIKNNPDSLDVRFEYAYLLWYTQSGTPEEIIEATLAYRKLMRMANGETAAPFDEPSSSLMLAEVMESKTDSLDRHSLFYRRRNTFIREAMHYGLYYPGYFSLPPDYIDSREEGDGV